jgi:hypothetical protein
MICNLFLQAPVFFTRYQHLLIPNLLYFAIFFNNCSSLGFKKIVARRLQRSLECLPPGRPEKERHIKGVVPFNQLTLRQPVV